MAKGYIPRAQVKYCPNPDCTKWHAYLQQHSTLTNSPLSVEPHSILGLVTHVTSEGKPLTEVAKLPQLPFFTVTYP